jgi:quinol monooxygenase YgiN
MTNSTNPVPSDNKIVAVEAFEHVHNEQASRYLELAQTIDDQVRETEPGMLVHALTKSATNGSETIFRWLEVFENSSALEAHINNPHVVAHIEKLNNGVLSNATELVIYAHWDEAMKTYWLKRLSGAELSFAPMETGFFLER